MSRCRSFAVPSNVAAGMKVPVAKIGAILPGDFRIKRAKLRGVESQGMICSAAELGLADSSSGIMPLPTDAPVGSDFRSYLGLDDRAIDVDLTPDRGDCLGLAGIAREVGVINRAPVTPPEMKPVDPLHDEKFPVELAGAGRAVPVTPVGLSATSIPPRQTPLWMQERLRRGDLRSIHPVVDVTNYVMLELGQPMHGFDLRQLQGGIRVRMAASWRKAAYAGWKRPGAARRYAGYRRPRKGGCAGRYHGRRTLRRRRGYQRYPAGVRLFLAHHDYRQGTQLWSAHRLIPPL